MNSTNHGVGVTVSRLVHIYHSEGQDVAALSGVDLHVAAGAMLALLGPSGAGKSTLLSLIAGLDRPTAGSITIGERRIDQLTDVQLDEIRGRELSLLLQGADRNLMPHLSIRENVLLAQWGRTTDVPAVDEVLDLLDLDERAAAGRPADLTPSQAQRAAMAVAIACRPGVLLADEPTSGLSGDAARTVIHALRRINTQWGTTVLTVTHDPAAAEAMDGTITIRDGRVGSQARDGVEVAVVAPDGSLPLPDDVLEKIPAGSFVRITVTPDDNHPRFVIEPWADEREDR